MHTALSIKLIGAFIDSIAGSEIAVIAFWDS